MERCGYLITLVLLLPQGKAAVSLFNGQEVDWRPRSNGVETHLRICGLGKYHGQLLRADNSHETQSSQPNNQSEPEELQTLTEQPTFIDKTQFVKHFLGLRKHLVVTAPPGFGKSTNIHMLKYFFEIPVDEYGSIDNERIQTKRSFLQKLSICANNASICDENMSKNPVIFIDFKGVQGQNAEAFFESFKYKIVDLFKAHDYLRNSEALRKTDKDEFEAYRNSSTPPVRTIGFYKRGLEVLAGLLFQHFQRKCMFFIDNFDALAIAALQGKDRDYLLTIEVDEIYSFIGKMAKHNPNVDRTLLTGVYRFGSLHVWHADNLYYHSIFDDSFINQYYGLTVQDVTILLDRLGKPHDFEAMERHGGYYVSNSPEKLFNTRSVLGYLTNDEKSWSPPALFSCLQPLFTFESLRGGWAEVLKIGIEIEPKWLVTMHDLVEVYQLMEDKKDEFGTAPYRDLVLQLLQEEGFFTVKERLPDGKVWIIVPNVEVKKRLEHLIKVNEF